MTTLVCDFQGIVGERINGYATLSTGEIRVGQDAPTVVLNIPTPPKQVVEGEATFENVEPGAAILQLHWEGQSATLRFTVPNAPETITLSECVEQTLEYTPPVVNRGLEQIKSARDDALADVGGAVDQALAGSQRYSGTGSPEGVVAAPVGSIYTDTAATNGAIRWLKTSGTGNTGWQVEPSADTITALSTWTADAVGGRNLLEKTGGDHLSTAGKAYNPSIVEEDGKKALAFNSSNNIINLGRTDIELKEGDKVSFSFKAKASKPLSLGRVYVGGGIGNNSHLRDQMVSTEWAEYSFSYTVETPTQVYVYMYPQIDNGDGTYETFYITEWKLEYGLRPTSWTPAPEDTVQSLLKGGPLSSLPSPIPALDPALSLRVDNSVGTRVFVGDTMIHGDTGWRIWAEGIKDGWLGEPYLRRIGSRVYLSFGTRAPLRVDPDADTINHPFVDIPNGFQSSVKTLGVGYLNDGYAAKPGWCYGTTSLSLTARPGMAFGNLEWETSQAWPDSLPGTPA